MIATPTTQPQEKKYCSCGGVRSDMQRIRRNAFMKLFLFWLPIKRYKCQRCFRNHWIMNQQAT